MTVVQYRAEEVANLQPATVSAYAYYSPGKSYSISIILTHTTRLRTKNHGDAAYTASVVIRIWI